MQPRGLGAKVAQIAPCALKRVVAIVARQGCAAQRARITPMELGSQALGMRNVPETG